MNNEYLLLRYEHQYQTNVSQSSNQPGTAGSLFHASEAISASKAVSSAQTRMCSRDFSLLRSLKVGTPHFPKIAMRGSLILFQREVAECRISVPTHQAKFISRYGGTFCQPRINSKYYDQRYTSQMRSNGTFRERCFRQGVSRYREGMNTTSRRDLIISCPPGLGCRDRTHDLSLVTCFITHIFLGS